LRFVDANFLIRLLLTCRKLLMFLGYRSIEWISVAFFFLFIEIERSCSCVHLSHLRFYRIICWLVWGTQDFHLMIIKKCLLFRGEVCISFLLFLISIVLRLWLKLRLWLWLWLSNLSMLDIFLGKRVINSTLRCSFGHLFLKIKVICLLRPELRLLKTFAWDLLR
jgi:hypothetical protein